MQIKRFVTALFSLCCLWASAAEYEVYDYSPELERSDRYAVSLDGREIVTIPTLDPHVAVFGTDGKVELKIKFLKGAPANVQVRPLGKSYDYELKGDELTLSLTTYDNVSVEADGDLDHPLFIFANPLEKESLEKALKDPDTYVFKAGRIYHRNMRNIFDDYENVYIQGGAVIDGCLLQEHNAIDCSIDGGGIIDNRLHRKSVAFHVMKSKNFAARNITIINSDYWCFRLSWSDYFTTDNVKAVGECPMNDNWDENDAIHFVCCNHGTVRHCFGYSWDDAYNVTSSFFANIGETSDIHFEDCVGWNVHPGNSFEISWSTKEHVHDISYKNIYAIHSGTKDSKNRRAGISIHNGGDHNVWNVRYENVWIEDPYENSISLFALKTGNVENIVYKNIHILKNAPRKVCIQGSSQGGMVRNVTFENIWIEGRRISDLSDPAFASEIFPLKYVQNVSIK